MGGWRHSVLLPSLMGTDSQAEGPIADGPRLSPARAILARTGGCLISHHRPGRLFARPSRRGVFDRPTIPKRRRLSRARALLWTTRPGFPIRILVV